jgi:hypothetical protein
MTVCTHDQQINFIGCNELRQDISDCSARGIDFIDDNADPVAKGMLCSCEPRTLIRIKSAEHGHDGYLVIAPVRAGRMPKYCLACAIISPSLG